jgi:hypothetical protein
MMSIKADSRKKGLTVYEQRQVEKIASWKAAQANPFAELFHAAVRPITWLVELVVPDSLALGAIDAAYKASELSATQSDIQLQANVRDIRDLHHATLEDCDRLSRRVGTMAQGLATVEGAATGAGGVWTTLADVPLLFALCLRTIIKTGHCYGYPLDRPSDKAWVLGALAVALSNSSEQRSLLLGRLRDIEELLIDEVQEDVLVQETASLLTQMEIFEDIPVFGAATGALLNLAVAHRTDVTARHLFQERWLRDNGKIDVVAPRSVPREVFSRSGWSGALARTGRSIVYGLSFSTAFPVYFLVGLLSPQNAVASSGSQDSDSRTLQEFNGRRRRVPV